jgi:site-specific DNA recombinase
VARTYSDNDTSAYNGANRTDFENMLAAVNRHQYDAVVAWHQDRLYRSMGDIERLIDACESTGTLIHTVSGGDLDLSNATGKGLARIVGSINRMESEHKAERVRAACKQRAEAGVWFTNVRVYGYTEAGAIVESEAQLIRKAAADMLAGRSSSSIVREWNAAGVTTARGGKWILKTFKRLFINPRYAGLSEYRGEIVGPGQWPAILTVDDHHGLAAVFKDKSQGTKGVAWERKWLGSRRYFCGRCGAKMEHYVNQQSHSYRCTASTHLTRRQAALDEYVEQLALGFLRDDAAVTKALAAAARSRGGVDATELRTRRAALQAQKDDLAAMFTEGVLDGPAVRREAAKLTDKIAAIDSALAELARRSPLAELMAEGAEHVETRWADASPDIKGKVIDELFSVIVLPIGKGGRPDFNPDGVRIVWNHQ